MKNSSIQRRSFLGWVSGTSAAVWGVVARPLRAAESPRRIRGMQDLSAEDFVDLVGKRLPLLNTKGESIVLREVRAENPAAAVQRPDHVRQQPFSLLFEAASDCDLGSRTHRVQHPRFGELPLFLQQTKVGPEQAVRYEAVFG